MPPIRPLVVVLAPFLWSGCKGKDPVESGDDSSTIPVVDVACDEAEALLGYRACVHQIADEDTFDGVTVASTLVDQKRVGKYLIPAVEAARLPGLFLDVNAFGLHYDFMVQAFPDLFAGLTTAQYTELTLHPATREFFAGTVSLYLDAEKGFFYGFTVWDDPQDETSTVTEADVEATWSGLQERFLIGDLVWVPNTAAQLEAAETWGETAFPVHGLADIPYEVYNQGEAYGTLQLYTLDSLEEATEEADYGYQNILAIEEAPTDLERVVSGFITGSRQGALSHLAVRSASRGTPNCYVQNVLTELASWEGQLVRFECGADGYTIESTTEAEAEAWWESIRPEPVDVCTPNFLATDFPGLLELPTTTEEERDLGKCTYGTKGTNLATLYPLIDAQYRLDGFLIPMSYYDDFVSTTEWSVDLGSGLGMHSFQETLEAWHADATFLADADVRRDRLDAIREAMGDATVDPALLDAVGDRIVDVFGNATTMVRFRSSSNAEDSIGFTGAGLYESESVCVADNRDLDDEGPSLCDPEKPDEETVEDGLKDVWKSLWNMRAWEERDWYGIDHLSVAMGVLCDTRTADEQANIVAFSGNIASPDDDRYLVDAQEGELDVVSTEPGVYPETDLLTIEDGVVTDIERVAQSTEIDEVLTDAELSELGAVFYDIAQVFPQDGEVPADQDLLWDTEWKFDADGQLIIKQIRPYLR
jgi:hypothetical protein